MTLRDVVLRIATIGIGILIAVLLSEVVLRLINFEFNLYPTKVQFGWPDPVTITSRYEPDKDLLWVPKDYPKLVASPTGAPPSLVLMGCSCTEFGKYDRFLAESIDTQYPDSTFTYVNLGVSGWSSYQGLEQLKRDVVPMRPRVITIYYGWNDHWCTFGFEDKHIGEFNLEHPEVLTRLSEWSRVVQLINKSLFSKNFQGKAASQRVSLEDFRANLKEIVRISRENSILPVFLTAPSAHQLGEEPAYLANRALNNLSELIPLHESYVQTVRDVAHEDNVYMVDLYRLFGELPREELDECFKTDGIHLTELGDRRLAHYLYEYFVQTGIIQQLVSR